MARVKRIASNGQRESPAQKKRKGELIAKHLAHVVAANGAVPCASAGCCRGDGMVPADGGHECGGCERPMHAICGEPFEVNGEAEEGHGARRWCENCVNNGTRDEEAAEDSEERDTDDVVDENDADEQGERVDDDTGVLAGETGTSAVFGFLEEMDLTCVCCVFQFFFFLLFSCSS